MGRKVNAEKGKQGFQPTVKGINAPTPAPQPEHTSHTITSEYDYEATHSRFARELRPLTPAEQDIFHRSDQYLYTDPDACDLTSRERDLLLTACRSSTNPIDTNFINTPEFREAWHTAENNPEIGSMLRRCYFTEDGQLRPDVGKAANYTAHTIYMNITLSKRAQESVTEHATNKTIAAIAHAHTEYVNDREVLGVGQIQYSSGNDYPQLDRLLKSRGVDDALNLKPILVGYYGPNAG